jgi:ribosomal protein S18 acetylase RimI-like enzyme
MSSVNILIKENIKYETEYELDYSSLRIILADVAPLYPNFETWLNFSFRRNLSSDERQLVLAYSGNQIAGVALLKNTFDEKKISTLYTCPQFRGQHVGDNLIELALAELDNADTFITVSKERNEELYPLLKSKGFKLSQSIDDLYREGNTEHFYKL